MARQPAGRSAGADHRYWQTYYYAGGDDAQAAPYDEAWYGVKDGKLYVKTTTDPYLNRQ